MVKFPLNHSLIAPLETFKKEGRHKNSPFPNVIYGREVVSYPAVAQSGRASASLFLFVKRKTLGRKKSSKKKGPFLAEKERSYGETVVRLISAFPETAGNMRSNRLPDIRRLPVQMPCPFLLEKESGDGSAGKKNERGEAGKESGFAFVNPLLRLRPAGFIF